MTDSSTEPADTSSVETNLDVNSEASSTTDSGVGSMREAIDAALNGQEAPPASTERDPKDPAAVPPAEKQPGAETELSEDELAKYSKGAQRRIRELVEKHKTAEAEVAPLRQELDTVKPKAERLDQLTGFMREHEITSDHLNNALGLTAMINRAEYGKAIPVLENLLHQVKAAAGEILPPELKSRVDLGYITEADAKTMHQAQLANRRSEQQVQKANETVVNERTQREVQTIISTATSTADAWTAEQVKSDPDWNQKRDLVTEGMELELHKLGPEGYPRTAKATRDLLDKVKSSVDAKIGRFRPAPKPVSHITGEPASPRTAAAPKSMMDAISAGACMLGTEPARDYYGNRIPSRTEVQEGTKGSYSYVSRANGEAWADMMAEA